LFSPRRRLFVFETTRPAITEDPVPNALAGRVVVVTGGNRGVGLGIARGVAAAGASVAIWARDPARNSSVTAELAAAGANVVAISADVSNRDEVELALRRTIEQFGRLDAIFANAGVTGRSVGFVDMTVEDWRDVFKVNLEGTFFCLQAVARQLVAQGEGGALIALGSIASRYGAPEKVAYATSKTAIGGLMRSLAVELAPFGIRCNTLSPGWIDTEMIGPGSAYAANEESAVLLRRWTVRRTPMQRWGRPDDLGRVAAFLADPAIVFHTGDDVVVDGGYTVA
jgi:NAD(P)-dependent dehydrogenase (short-subunit alcohol dehydrogenase family)